MHHRPKRWKTGLAAMAAALMLAPLAAWAGPLEDANARYRAGDYRGALSLLQQAREQEPDNPQVYVGLGKTYRRLGDDRGALEAYRQIFRIDPELRSVQDREGFLRSYRALGGEVPPSGAPGSAGSNEAPGSASGATTSASDIITALSERGVFVVPGLRDQVDENTLRGAVEAARPVVVKIAVLGGLGQYRDRDALAADLRQRLNLGRTDVVVVATPRGVSASTEALSRAQIQEAVRRSNYDVLTAQQGPAAGIAAVAGSVARASTERVAAGGRSSAGLILLLVLGGGGFLAWRKAQAARRMNEAREPLEALRQRVVADLSYVDGYLDLLPKGAEADAARRLRADAFEKYDTATGILKTARTPEEVRQAGPLLEDAGRQLEDCKRQIDAATGGTGVAMGLAEMPSLMTTEEKGRRYLRAEDLRTERDREEMQREIESIPPHERGVSFFSGQPLPANELIPVTIVVQGQKRTVMASRDEAAAIARGETPAVRAFEDPSGRPVPWYEYRGYDPYRDYYGNPGLLAASNLLNLYVITSLMGPAIWGGYGPWGFGGFGWGMPIPVGGFGGWGGYGDYGYGGGYPEAPPVQVPENAGGMDLFGADYNEHGGGFDVPAGQDSGWFGGGSDDGGGFDVGGGDFGGGGGGDFGGGGDW